MQAFADFLNMLDGYLGSGAWFPYALLGTGLLFTIYLKFPQFRFFKHAINVVKGKYEKEHHEGDTSHFQALNTALSGTVGTGNIAGVALAIHMGGPAALFWMWMSAFLGMTTKFVEVLLSHKYRIKDSKGNIAGGPFFYMRARLNIVKKDGSVIKTGAFLGVIAAIATVLSSFGTGNMPQINSIANAVKNTWHIEPWMTGAFLAILLALVILGGIKRIAAVSEKFVPTMAIIYIIGSLSVILNNLGNIGPGFAQIFGDLFTGTAAVGGFLGASVSFAYNRGVARGLFSNEAGQGSAPIAHAAARADEPVSEGVVAILEPFIDTIIICTLTGLVIISSGAWNEKFQNDFQRTDMQIVSGIYSEQNAEQKDAISKHYLRAENDPVQQFSGEIVVENGLATSSGFTILHNRSFAEDVQFTENGNAFTGTILVHDGNIDQSSIDVHGKSLVHSVSLTNKAFNRGFFGDYGEWIVTIGILLFAFSTVISWSYYGDRAMTYLFGASSVVYYRIVYIGGFFAATLVDTSIIWIIANVVIVLMCLPNLLGLLILRKEIKTTIDDYVVTFNKDYPNEKQLK